MDYKWYGRMKIVLIIIVLLISGFQLQAQPIPYHNLNLAGIERSGHAEAGPAQPAPLLPGEDDPEFKSVGKALLLSLILPGAGELYMGSKGFATFFLSTEIIAWTGLVGNQLYARHLEDEYKTYAVQHARVYRSGKDKQYWIDIGKYNDIYEFNEQRRRDRYFDAIYEENEINYWMWDSRSHRFRYDGKRIRANEIAGQDVYFYAAVMLNHLVSGINAMRLARKYNSRLQNRLDWSLNVDSYRDHPGSAYLGLRLNTTF